MNDNSNLYVLVDAVGDKTFAGSDECLLVFGFTSRVALKVYGDGTLSPTTGFDGAVGFDSSPNSPETAQDLRIQDSSESNQCPARTIYRVLFSLLEKWRQHRI